MATKALLLCLMLLPLMGFTDLANQIDGQSLDGFTKKLLSAKLNIALAALAVPNLPQACQSLQDFNERHHVVGRLPQSVHRNRRA